MNPERLEELVGLFVERKEDGEEITIEQFLSEHGSDEPELRETLQTFLDTESMFTSVSTGAFEKIGPYRLLRQIGRGGMGLVFEGEKEPGQRVAVKLLDLASHMNQRAVTRLVREGDILKRLQHPNIVRILDSGEDRGSPYLVMELLSGQSLSDIGKESFAAGITPAAFLHQAAAKKEKEAWMQGALLVHKIARATEHAHNLDLLHRDIKPSNVFVDEKGEPTLLDFGLARDQEASTLTHTGDLLGTPVYMAPEQARGDAPTAATDVYGLGVLLFEVLSGETIVRGKDPLEILHDVSRGEIRSLREVLPDCDRKILAIVDTATAFDPQDRYFSAQALADDLLAAIEDRSINAKRSAFITKKLWKKRSQFVIVALVIVSLLIVVLQWPEDKDALRDTAIQHAALQAEALNAWILGDVDQSRTLMATCMEIAGGDPMSAFLEDCILGRVPMNSENPAVAKLVEGERARQSKNYSLAIPGLMLAKLAIEDKRFDLAERELEFAKRRFPQSAAIRSLLARVQYKREQYAASVEEYKLAIRKNPKDINAWRGLARSLYYVGNYQEGLLVAREAFEKLGAKGAASMFVLAALLDKNGRPSEAQDILKELIRKNPKDMMARFNLAYSLDSEHKSVEAVSVLENILKEESKDVKSMVLLANIYSGADRNTCPGCAKNYFDYPALMNPKRATDLAIRIIKTERGSVRINAQLAATYARKSGAVDRFLEVLNLVARGLAIDAEKGRRVSSQIVNLEQARLKLESPPEED